jgi:hypothetical protein
MGVYLRAPKDLTCDYCGTSFHVKVSRVQRYKRTLGLFCSRYCASQAKKEAYLGELNPNFRNVGKENGYLVDYKPGEKRIMSHRRVVKEYLEIANIPKGYEVHHRDCDKTNNNVGNLALLSKSDHWWLHKNYGIDALSAIIRGAVALDVAATWSSDPNRALSLLKLDITKQLEVFKLGEFGESPEEGNADPSYS